MGVREECARVWLRACARTLVMGRVVYSHGAPLLVSRARRASPIAEGACAHMLVCMAVAKAFVHEPITARGGPSKCIQATGKSVLCSFLSTCIPSPLTLHCVRSELALGAPEPDTQGLGDLVYLLRCRQMLQHASLVQRQRCQPRGSEHLTLAAQHELRHTSTRPAQLHKHSCSAFTWRRSMSAGAPAPTLRSCMSTLMTPRKLPDDSVSCTCDASDAQWWCKRC